MNTMEQTQAEAEIEYYQERFKNDYEKAKAVFMEAARDNPMNAFTWKGQALLEAQALLETAETEGFYDADFCQEKASNLYTDLMYRVATQLPYQFRNANDLINASDSANAKAKAELIRICQSIISA